MKNRPLVAIVLIVFVGLFARLALQYKLDLGSFAESPQLMEIPWGARAIVGGGLAGIDFEEMDGEIAHLRLWCEAGEIDLRLEPGDESEQACGVRVRMLAFLSGRDAEEKMRAAVEITWD